MTVNFDKDINFIPRVLAQWLAEKHSDILLPYIIKTFVVFFKTINMINIYKQTSFSLSLSTKYNLSYKEHCHKLYNKTKISGVNPTPLVDI